MKKEDFQQAIRGKLGEVPLESRKQWNDTNLLDWWNKVRAENSYLTWDHHPDAWPWVKGMCANMIGERAIY